jgi:hypothetical protein
MIMICNNEYGIHWVADSRLPEKAFSVTDTPAGTYWSIAAAFSGEELKVIFFQKTGESTPLFIDPLWVGILPALTQEFVNNECDSGLLVNYLDLISPMGFKIKKATEDYLNESVLEDFNVDAFSDKIASRYNLEPCQVLTVVRQGQNVKATATASKTDSFKVLDSLFGRIKKFTTDVYQELAKPPERDLESMLDGLGMVLHDIEVTLDDL